MLEGVVRWLILLGRSNFGYLGMYIKGDLVFREEVGVWLFIDNILFLGWVL